ncbi:MAG TPA: hypothetical protein PL001_10740 [Candidatus Kryptobacter bacterium]|nr:hypothetical protein [Candidatus Kryptobacter bacterium]
MKSYRAISLSLSAIFALVGILFVAAPDAVIGFFNALSSPLGMAQSPPAGFNFYLILAGGYMYVVAVLAFMMYRFPKNIYFPLLLAHAKLASSVLSLGMFLFQSGYLIYITNLIVDWLIGSLATAFYMKMRRTRNWASS